MNTKKIFNFEFKALEEDKTFDAVISTEVVDRDGEVLLASGCDYSDFLKTGTVLWQHNQDCPIGKCTKIYKTKGQIKAKVKFADNDELASKIYNLTKQGIIKGVSVGFMTKEHRLPSKKDLQDYGKEVTRVISKWSLYEFSIVSVPCNQDALITSVKSLIDKKEITEADAKLIFNIEIKKEKEEKTIEIKEPVSLVLNIKKSKSVDKKIDLEIKRLRGQIYKD